MSQITHNDELVTKTELGQFYQGIYPYLNGSAHTGFTPVGTVISVMGTTAPQNYLACDGTVYNIADYLELANYFTAQFGSADKFGGNGTTTFAVPDLRGEFLRGSGTNGHSGEGDGANVGTHQAGTKHIEILPGTSQVRGVQGNVQNIDKQGDTILGYYQTNASSYDPLGQFYTSRPTNTSVLYCIATKNIYIDARFNYSTEEQVVGTWIDGRTIYQKTINFGSLPNNATKAVAHGISGLYSVIEQRTTWYYNSTWGDLTSADMTVWTDKTYITILTVADKRSVSAYVTLLYTKSS